MGWTYSGNPSDSTKDAVRFLLGDTDSSSPLVTDEEIAYAVAEEGDARLAASVVAKAIASVFGRKADKSVGDLHISYKSQADYYSGLAVELTAKSTAYAMPYAGGISISDKDASRDNSDRVRPSFSRSMDDAPGAATDGSNNPCDSDTI